jgi:tRNA(fMet)-specific endonuclease VapC
VAVLIDTDVLIDLERGATASALESVLADEQRAISVITVSELLHGVLRATAGGGGGSKHSLSNTPPGFPAIPITEPVARVHAGIWAELAQRGDAIGAHDLWIAATGLAHGLAVATRNVEDYERVPGLRVLAVSA